MHSRLGRSSVRLSAFVPVLSAALGSVFVASVVSCSGDDGGPDGGAGTGTGGSMTAAGAGGTSAGAAGSIAGSTPIAGAAGSAGTAGSAGAPVVGAGAAGAPSAGAAGTPAVAGAGGTTMAGSGGTGGGAAGMGPVGGAVSPPAGKVQMEDLNRGVVAVVVSGGVYVGWRMLGYDPDTIAFNVYRNGMKVNAAPIADSTNYLDAGGNAMATYTVRPVINGAEQGESEKASTWAQQYRRVPIQAPPGGSTPSGSYTYTANDASVGDLDGDGDYEIVLKWEPSNAQDNSNAGYTGNVFLDAYDMDGTRLWRINLGRNIRAGAHYTQFMVYDFDGDGDAEVACKTADGTVDGKGTAIGNTSADHRNADGYVLAGPEFLTMFDGMTGAAVSTVNYNPPRGTVSTWGDTYGNRVDRFLGGVAYLDGQRPSLIMARGYYTRTVIVAWDFRDGTLKQRWAFDTMTSNHPYAGQGDHSLSIADVDQDGRQEVVYGAAVIDDDGKGLHTTGWGHGDALHVGDFIPSRPGIEIFNIQERVAAQGANLRDGRTGAAIFTKPTTSADEGPGRGVAEDIFAGNPGAEFWVSGGGIPAQLYSATGANVGRVPSSCNFLAWWDADPVRELLDRNRIDKYGTSGETRLLTAEGAVENNGTKATPALSGDLFGDWREEVIWRESNNSALRVYTTTNVTTRRIYTLMHDAQYRVAIAWQNTAYNQPPHPSFFIGDGMTAPPRPDIHVR